MITVSLIILGVAAVLFLGRLFRGPTLADRVNAVNGVLIVGMGAIAAQAVRTDQGAFLPILVVIGLVGFVGTAMVARFIEGQGR